MGRIKTVCPFIGILQDETDCQYTMKDVKQSPDFSRDPRQITNYGSLADLISKQKHDLEAEAISKAKPVFDEPVTFLRRQRASTDTTPNRIDAVMKELRLEKPRASTCDVLSYDHSFSPDLKRNRSKTLGNDSCFLSIPFNTPPTPHRGRHQTFIGEIDVSTYSDDECGRNPSPLPLPEFPQFNDIASFQCVFQYIRDENTVLVELRDLRTDFKPFSYKGARIKQRYIVKLEIHCVDSPKPFRNSLKRRESTPYVELLLGKPTEIQLKHKPTDKTTMRLRLYEATRQNRHLTCGYVNVSVNDVIKCSETCYLVNETFQLCSESSGKARGSVSGSIQWDEKFHSVHVKIHSVTREKVSKKENLVQLTAYIEDREIDHHTTHTVCSPNIDVKFREKLSFIIPKNHQGDSKITDLSLTIQLCEHGVLSTTHQGKAVVGPNMYTDGETCWQKALNYPGHDVDFQLPLY